MKLHLAAFVCILYTGLTYGSLIVFQSSPVEVKQGLTPTLTLKCSLSDTAASTTIVGKRDVTQTTDNMQQVTSLVIMKDGRDVASVTSALAAHVMDGSANVKATGSVTSTSSQQGFLQLTFSDPSVNQTGEFSCEANAVSLSGHIVTFTSTVEVMTSEPTVADLVTYVRDLSKKNERLEKENAALKTDFAELKNRSEQMVFFNAKQSDDSNNEKHLTNLQTLLFDIVLDNYGGSYNINTGQFECTTPGFYHFSLGCLSSHDHVFRLDLEHNGKRVFEIYASAGQAYQEAANTATLQLSRGDIVKVVAHEDSWILGYYCNFSGHLIKAT